MATKGTNAKIKELKGIKPEKITDEQLKKIQDSLSAMQEEFEKEYGTFDINIQDGTINYKEDVEADKKD